MVPSPRPVHGIPTSRFSRLGGGAGGGGKTTPPPASASASGSGSTQPTPGAAAHTPGPAVDQPATEAPLVPSVPPKRPALAPVAISRAARLASMDMPGAGSASPGAAVFGGFAGFTGFAASPAASGCVSMEQGEGLSETSSGLPAAAALPNMRGSGDGAGAAGGWALGGSAAAVSVQRLLLQRQASDPLMERDAALRAMAFAAEVAEDAGEEGAEEGAEGAGMEDAEGCGRQSSWEGVRRQLLQSWFGKGILSEEEEEEMGEEEDEEADITLEEGEGEGREAAAGAAAAASEADAEVEVGAAATTSTTLAVGRWLASLASLQSRSPLSGALPLSASTASGGSGGGAGRGPLHEGDSGSLDEALPSMASVWPGLEVSLQGGDRGTELSVRSRGLWQSKELKGRGESTVWGW